MKKILTLLLFMILIITIQGCSSNSNNSSDDLSDVYSLIIGDKSKELVSVKFVAINYEGANDRVWGVEKGLTLGYDYEPKYPHFTLTMAEYGLSPDFTPTNGKIQLATYQFLVDTTIYVKYYGGLVTRRFCIPNGPTNKGSGMMFESRQFFYNTEVYSLPTLENQSFETDWGTIELMYDLTPWINQWGYTKIVGWYYDEELTNEVTVPFKVGNDGNIWFWVKGE
ncbi:hypothetical protein [Paracholeplasma manati]|uniref:hypothetical protein n=1 Tax=Paracholeplasma manati TaxID=591373 RepID=UPI0024078E45|nr:hypothetical protein [Paracholeplasma manati]MDG0889203.1 hypothetical protein [Paracholeplasma manati]